MRDFQKLVGSVQPAPMTIRYVFDLSVSFTILIRTTISTDQVQKSVTQKVETDSERFKL